MLRLRYKMKFTNLECYFVIPLVYVYMVIDLTSCFGYITNQGRGET